MKTLLKYNFIFILKNCLGIYFIFLVFGFTAKAIIPELGDRFFGILHTLSMIASFFRVMEISPSNYEKWACLIPLNDEQKSKVYNLTLLFFSLLTMAIYLGTCFLYDSVGTTMYLSFLTIGVSLSFFYIPFFTRDKNKNQNLNIFKFLWSKKRYFIYISLYIAFILISGQTINTPIIWIFTLFAFMVEHLIFQNKNFNIKFLSLNNVLPILYFCASTALLYTFVVQSKNKIIQKAKGTEIDKLFYHVGTNPFIYSATDMKTLLESPLSEKSFKAFYILFKKKYPQSPRRGVASQPRPSIKHPLEIDFYKTIKSKKEFIPFLFSISFFPSQDLDDKKIEYYLLRTKKFDTVEQQMILRNLKKFVSEAIKDKIDEMLVSFENNCHKSEKVNRNDYHFMVPEELFAFEYCSY